MNSFSFYSLINTLLERKKEKRVIGAPIVLVVGLSANQQISLSREFAGKLNLLFLGISDFVRGRRESVYPEKVDYVILVTAHLPHTVDRVVMNKYGNKVIRTQGGFSSVKNIIYLTILKEKPQTYVPLYPEERSERKYEKVLKGYEDTLAEAVLEVLERYGFSITGDSVLDKDEPFSSLAITMSKFLEESGEERLTGYIVVELLISESGITTYIIPHLGVHTQEVYLDEYAASEARDILVREGFTLEPVTNRKYSFVVTSYSREFERMSAKGGAA